MNVKTADTRCVYYRLPRRKSVGITDLQFRAQTTELQSLAEIRHRYNFKADVDTCTPQ